MTAVELTSDEDALISLLRGEAGVPFNLVVSNYGSAWAVTLHSDDGVISGQGGTFRQAFLQAFGYVERGAKAAPPALRLVSQQAGSGAA